MMNAILNFRKISIITEDIFRKLFLGVTFEGGFHPLNSFFRKKNMSLLFFDKLHIQGDAFNLRHSNISKNKHTTKKC